MSNNNLAIPLSIVVAGGLVAVALFFGLSNGNQSADVGLDEGAQVPTQQLSWADAELHRTYAETLGLDADMLVECFENRTHSEKVRASSQEGVSNGVQGTPHFLINGEAISGAQPFSVFQESIELALSQGTVFDDEVETEGFPVMGDSNAPVLMVEYSDFACPFCGRFHNDAKRQIISEYIDTGKVKFVRKDFIAVGGGRAAEAAHCAGDQGAYWEYADLLYANQSDR